MIFRANTVATKSFDHYLKLVGITYLQIVLKPFLKLVYSTKQSCEMDPSRLQKSDDLKKNRDYLLLCVTTLWNSIQNSLNECPS